MDTTIVQFEATRRPSRLRPAARASTATAPAVLTVPEVADYLRLSLASTYTYLRNGTIPAERIGRRWIISRARLVAWLDSTGESGER